MTTRTAPPDDAVQQHERSAQRKGRTRALRDWLEAMLHAGAA